MEPKNNCNLCSRLVDLRKKNKILFPNFYNNRVLGTGPLSSELLIISLAPGLLEQIEQVKFLMVTFLEIYYQIF